MIERPYIKNLNISQFEAVTTTEGFVRVIAGAGSGKTRALSSRFAWLVNDLGILPGNILCVTFTNRAANEMRNRIHRLTGDNDTGYINTFHGFCVNVLKEDSWAMQYPKNFMVLDNSDIDAMLEVIYEERGLTMRDMTYSDARDMIEMQKLLWKPKYYQDLLDLSIDVLKQKYIDSTGTADIIFYGYLYMEKKCFGLDYNDLIKCTLHIFETHEDIRLKWQERLEYIMIDEFQDIDPPQYELMEVLCGLHKNLFVVGDPDQTIYSWRGADIAYLLNFDKKFPGTKTVMMMENYRSVPSVLAAANSLIDTNKNRIKKELIAVRAEGRPIKAFHAKAASDEGAWIAGKMSELHEEGIPFSDMAVLYRAHYVSRTVEDALMAADIPYSVYSGVAFFGRKEVKDVLAYLRMMVTQDDLAFRRVVNVPKRNIGKTRMKYLEDLAAEKNCTLFQALEFSLETPEFSGTKAQSFVSLVREYSGQAYSHRLSDLVSSILNDSGYEAMLRTEGSQERLDNVAELKQMVIDYETESGEEVTADDFLAYAALFSNSDMASSEDKVKLMTVHAAKGLEFPYVFICGLNEGIFPSRKVKTIQAMEEERRLAFVAMTRAMDGLFLSESEGKNHDGSYRYPSRFILDISDGLIDYESKPEESLIRNARASIESSEGILLEDDRKSLMAAGTRVKHPVFGEGIIESIDFEKSAYVIRFNKLSTTRKIAFRVRLEEL